MPLIVDDRVPEKVLVIVAHPDDIEFGAAGSVARWVKAGAQAAYCIVTDGAAGSNEPGADLAALARQRQEEQRAAAALVGVTDICFLGYPDGILTPTLELRRDLTRVIRQVRPDRVVCQDPTTVLYNEGYINHPDHRASGEAALYAVFPSAGTRPIFPELLDEGLEPHDVAELYLTLTQHPTHVLDISATFDLKAEALLRHQSQVSEEAAQWIGEWNAESGKEYGFAYAEVFRVMRFVEDEESAAQSGD
jgi:LmbE family N-acetylglucosaminyl deacetylase